MPAKKISGDKLITVVPPFRIKYKDAFELKAFYKALKEWLLEYNWQDLEEGKDKFERFYGERIQGGAKEIWIRWRPTRMADGAKLRYYLDFDFHCLGVTNAEVIIDGKKFKVNKGEIELSVGAYIEEIYKKDLEKHKFLKHFVDLFAQRVYHKTVEQRKKELYQETYALQTFMKQWFKMKRYQPYADTKDFAISEAYPSHLKSK